MTIPPIAGGSGAITDFKVTIKKSWTYKGKKMSFINAKCPASKKLKYRGAFTYKDGTTIESATHTPALHAEGRNRRRRRSSPPAEPLPERQRLTARAFFGARTTRSSCGRHPARGRRQPPDPVADSSISAGSRTMRTTVASRMTATVRPTPSWLTVAIGAPAKTTKTAIMIAAAPVITAAVFAEAEPDRGGVVVAGLVVLAHAAEQEDRVVDREPEDDGEDHQAPTAST